MEELCGTYTDSYCIFIFLACISDKVVLRFMHIFLHSLQQDIKLTCAEVFALLQPDRK